MANMSAGSIWKWTQKTLALCVFTERLARVSLALGKREVKVMIFFAAKATFPPPWETIEQGAE